MNSPSKSTALRFVRACPDDVQSCRHGQMKKAVDHLGFIMAMNWERDKNNK
jgi:hypothetical protein